MGGSLTRREFLGRGARLMAGAGAAFGLVSVSGGAASGQQRALAQRATSLWEQPGMTPEIAPVGQIYTVSINLWHPRIDYRNYTHELSVLADRPLTLPHLQ